MGWVAKSFPAERAGGGDAARAAADAPDLARTCWRPTSRRSTRPTRSWASAPPSQTAPQWHALSGQLRPGAGEFGSISREQGLRAALDWRDRASARPASRRCRG